MQSSRRDNAFSLIELVIVVVIIAIIGAIAVPRYGDFAQRAKQSSYASEINNIVEQVYQYGLENGGYPPHEAGFGFPSELLDLFGAQEATFKTPYGGVWRYKNQLGSVWVGAFRAGGSPDVKYMTRIDSMIDDGNVLTGKFRAQGVAWYWILVE